MAWSPQARKGKTFPLEVSRDPHTGEAAATITVEPWSARTRLDYLDVTTTQGFTVDSSGARHIRSGFLLLERIARTVTAATGFGDVEVERDGEVVSEPFDPTDPAHLAALDADVFNEIANRAEAFTPSGRSAQARKVGTQPTTPAPSAPSDGEDGEDEDPSPAPSTPAAPAAPSRRRSPRRSTTSTPES